MTNQLTCYGADRGRAGARLIHGITTSSSEPT